MCKRIFHGAPLAGAILLLAAPAAQAASIVSDFEGGTVQGWSISEALIFEQRQPGGNPGGYLHIDNTETGIAILFAPAAFLGNLGAFDGGVFSFDGTLLGAGGSFWESAGQDYGWVTITGTNADSASVDLLPGGAVPSASAWETFSVNFTAAAWGKSDSAWADILADVAQIRIVVEGLFGPEVQGIDNISLRSVDLPPSETPVPAALPLFATGLGIVGSVGWWRRRRRNG